MKNQKLLNALNEKIETLNATFLRIMDTAPVVVQQKLIDRIEELEEQYRELKFSGNTGHTANLIADNID
jgi:predicted metal-dependent hydrolase